MKDTVHLDITWGSLFRIAIFAAIIVMLFIAREVVGVLLVSIVVSLGLHPFVSFFEKFRWGRFLSTFLVFLLGALAVAAIFYLVIPVIIIEAGSFIQHFNRIISPLLGAVASQKFFTDVSARLTDAIGFLSASNFSLTGAIGQVFNQTVLFIATVIISFYLTLEERGMERLIEGFLPEQYERTAFDIFGHFKVKVRQWFVAQLGLSVLMGCIVGFGAWALGLNYPLVLGLIAAVFELVPLVGSVITGVLAFLVAVSQSLTLGIYVAILFIVIQQLEAHILIPVIMGRSVQVHPVMVILAILVGGTVAGILGVFLSVPIAVLVEEVLGHFAKEKQKRTLANE